MTVQLPDTDGTMGNSNGGAGNVNAVWADADVEAAPMAPSTANKRPNNLLRATPYLDKRRLTGTA
jgi:hypothetical protein